MQEPKATSVDYQGLGTYIREHGWPRGLELFAQEDLERGYQISTDLWPRHASWKGLLPFAHRESALVIEGGCGTVALSMARDFDRVDVVATTPDIFEGTRARVSCLGADNLSISQTFECHPGRYDAVAVCGVDPGYVERNLPEIVRSLRVHGSLYVAFDSPRANSIRSVFSPPYHRIAGMLRRRFDCVNGYWYLGSMTQAFELRAIGWHQPRWKYRVGGLVAPYLGGTFGIAASMAQAGPSLFEEILAAAGPALGVERYLFAHPVGFSLIVRDSRNGRRSIIRIPSDEHSFERARTNFDNLTLLRGLNAAPVEIPVQVQRGEVRGKVFFMEHMLDGRNLHRTELTDERLYAAVAADATHRLIALHKATVHPVELTPAHSEHLIGDILRNARVALAGDKGRHVLPEIEECLLSVFAGKRLNLVFFHGDYTYDNLMFDAARHCVTGMFDWDLSRPQGLPLLDLLYFLITAERGRTGGWVPGIFADRVKHGFSPVEQQCIDTYCRALDIPADLVMPLFVLTCLHHVGIRMYSPEPYAIFQTYWTAFLHAVPGALHRTPAAGVL